VRERIFSTYRIAISAAFPNNGEKANIMMKKSTILRQIAALALSVSGCFADSIGTTDTTGLVFDPFDTGTQAPDYQGYFLQPGTGYTTPLDGPGFAELGILPGSLLFTPNTMFAFDGTPVIAMLSANVDPGQGYLPLSGPAALVLNFVLPADGSQSTVPEPYSLYLAGAGFAFLYTARSRRVRAR
jgi:hypothetical protein